MIIDMADDIYQNPDNIPIEDLKITVNNDGVVKSIPALDAYWVEDRDLSLYSPPPVRGKPDLGSLDSWKESMEWYINDLKWLLSLEYHRFWSNIVHHSSCMDMLISFLQEANPPYLSTYEDSSVVNLYNQAYKKVFVIFSRLITNKEREDKWMTREYLGKIIYDKFIFTIPIIYDLCLIYGNSNKTHIAKLMDGVFYIQPSYYEDLRIAISFMKQVFDFISIKIDKNSSDILPEVFKGFSQNFCGRQSNSANVDKISYETLKDFVLHILDSAATVKIFLELHTPARKIFKDKEFYLSIVHFYENTIPKMYERVQELNGIESKDVDTILNQLNIMRVELIDCFRFIISDNIDNILAGSNIEENVSSYLTILTDSLSEKTFIADYNNFYSVDVDLDILCQSYEDMDPVKCDFILQAVYSNYDETDMKSKKIKNYSENNIQLSNGLENTHVNSDTSNANEIPKEAQTQSLISEVRDILPDLGEGFVLKCLEHYSFNTERVINCILEGNLDESLQKLDHQLPIIPVDPLDAQFLKTGIDRLNVFDNDEFDVMTRDKIDLSKVHKGKKKFQHKNLNEMLNDKSHIKQLKDTYAQYSLISEDNDIYDDEYDDTYDDGSRDLVNEATTELDRKQIRKVVSFRDTEECQGESEDESDDNDNSKFSGPKPPDSNQFCVNPEELRARYQARRDLKYGNKNNVERDVVGKAKGQGQDKDVLLNRQKKAQHKSTKANHNRRSGAQWKRSQGFIPS